MHLVYCWRSNTLFVCLVWVVHVFLIVFGSLSSVVVLINSIHNNGLEIWRRCTLWNVSVCVIDRKKASHTRINMFLRGNQLNPIEGQLMAFFFRYFGCWCFVFYGKYIPIKNNPFVCGLGKRSTWLTGRTQRKTANSLLLMGQILIMLWGIYTFGFAFGLCQISQQLPGKHENFLNPVHSTDALTVSAQKVFHTILPHDHFGKLNNFPTFVLYWHLYWLLPKTPCYPTSKPAPAQRNFVELADCLVGKEGATVHGSNCYVLGKYCKWTYIYLCTYLKVLKSMWQVGTYLFTEIPITELVGKCIK